MAHRCKVCSHPVRAAIDGDLVRGLSLRTVSGRYGPSVGTLHHHRTWHVLEPTVGDILDPDGLGQGWQQWDGTRWINIPEQDREALKEVSKGRSDHMCNRSQHVMIDPNNPRSGIGVLVRRVYRRRRTPKPLTAEASVDRQGGLLVANRDRFDWRFVQLVLNGQYGRYLARFPARKLFRFPMSGFVDHHGTPFDWRSTEPRRVRLAASIETVPKGYRRGTVTLPLGNARAQAPVRSADRVVAGHTAATSTLRFGGTAWLRVALDAPRSS